ncbi:BatD family protein [Rheinheimera fenheensis]|uniref:BatD family protein n=1 Tax=Rheinheimera fenheensis TaxID=3152295 RepID=UPI00325F73E9
MVKAAVFFTVLLASLPVFALSQLSAQLDKNPALRGESVTLQVTADARLPADAINFRVLEADFTVMLPSVSTSSQVINGQASQSTRWNVVLLPKKTGRLNIPAFSVQGLSTEPMTLEVLDEAPTNRGQNQELFLQASIDQQKLYVQQLTYYQVTIYFNGDLQRGSLSEPQLEGASISQVGQDVEGTELVNGIRYRTITRRYAITPQRSGNFSISPPTFNGEMVDRDSARYNYFARTKTVVAQGQPLDISVNAIPANFPGSWLVAGLVTLTEEWTPELSELKQGEPVTRTITLSAVDVAENQLPELNQQFPDGLRLYQEQPQSKSAERNGRLVAQKIFTSAVVANKAGELELPEVRLPWWNSQTNQLDYATLPARTLKVAGAPQASVPAPASPATIAAGNKAVASVSTGINATSPWAWNYLSSLLSALWLCSSVLLLLLWQRSKHNEPAATAPSRVRFNASKLQQACQQNDARAAKAELLRFAHQQLDQRLSALTPLSQLIHDTALRHEILQLNQALYGETPEAWQGQALWQCWQQYRRNQPEDAPASTLKPLYPN